MTRQLVDAQSAGKALSAINLAFFLSYGIAVSYYLIPIALLSLWSLLFAGVMHDTETPHAEPVPV